MKLLHCIVIIHNTADRFIYHTLANTQLKRELKAGNPRFSLPSTQFLMISSSRLDSVNYISVCRSDTQLCVPLHCKKRLDVFPSLAGMSLTKLSLGGNIKIVPGQGEFGKWHPGWGRVKPLYSVLASPWESVKVHLMRKSSCKKLRGRWEPFRYSSKSGQERQGTLPQVIKKYFRKSIIPKLLCLRVLVLYLTGDQYTPFPVRTNPYRRLYENSTVVSNPLFIHICTLTFKECKTCKELVGPSRYRATVWPGSGGGESSGKQLNPTAN